MNITCLRDFKRSSRFDYVRKCRTVCIVFLLQGWCPAILSGQDCSVRGRVLDLASREPIAYANVVVYSGTDFLDGAITNDKGDFQIRELSAGKYQLKISFIGYQSVLLNDVLLEPGIRDLGEIGIAVLTENLGEVRVEGTKPPMTYAVDRKVIDAGSFPGADVAMDLLENIPSVQVDFEGKLTYRGEGTFKVYVNGHPVANGEEKLQQLPAGQIDKIEIITNPSARFDAEGTAGIIHVLLKKNRLEGYAVNTSIRATSHGAYQWLFNIDYKKKKNGWYARGQLGRRIWEHYRIREDQSVLDGDLTHLTGMDYTAKRGIDQSNLELGFNYDLTEKDYIDFSGYIYPMESRQFHRENGSVTEITAEEEGSTTQTGYLFSSRLPLSYQFVGGTLTWEHAFNRKRTHLLSAYLDCSGYLQKLKEKQVDTKVYDSYTERTGYTGSERNEFIVEGKLTYTLPVSEMTSMESGVQVNTDRIPKVTSVSGSFDETGTITAFEDEPVDQAVKYSQNVYSGFVTFQQEWDKLALQLGMRAEHTSRRSDYSYEVSGNTRETVPARDRFTHYFPSVHLTYSPTETNQFHLAYSRRIQRPNYWKLIPLEQYDTPYLYYKGNGTLQPAMTNAWEGGFKKSRGKDFVSAEVFIRKTRRVIQDYSRIREGNVLVYSPENVGKSLSTGAEFMTGVDLLPWWNVNLSVSLYDYRLKMDFEDIQEETIQFKSDSRLNQTFRLPESFTVKWDVLYNSPLRAAQVKRDGYFVSNLSVRKSIGGGKWTFIFSVNDIFSSKQYDQEVTGTNFHIRTTRTDKSFCAFRITWSLDHQK